MARNDSVSERPRGRATTVGALDVFDVGRLETGMTETDLEMVTKPLSDQRLISVEKMDYTWFFRFTGEITIATEALWRLIHGRIVVTSEDHLQGFGRPEPVDAAGQVVAATAGARVEGAAISPDAGDLVIHFKGGGQLQLLQTSCEFESWRLDVGRSHTVCTAGGEIVHFPG